MMGVGAANHTVGCHKHGMVATRWLDYNLGFRV